MRTRQPWFGRGSLPPWGSVAAALAVVLGLAPLAAASAPQPLPPPQAVALPAAGGAPAGRYLIDLPPGGGRGAPLLLALHGAASSPEALRDLTGLSAAAAAAGVAVVYPAAAGVLWNDGRGAVPGFTKLTPRDDVAFLEAVVADAVRRYGLDRSHVSVVGLGSGGSMALELACRAPSLAQSLVVVNASLWDYQQRGCASSGLPSLLLLHGDADARHPWQGRDLASEGVQARSLGVVATASAWAKLVGCGGGTGGGASAAGAAGAASSGGSGGGAATRAGSGTVGGSLIVASGCPAGRFVAALRIHGEGGAWPRPSRAVRLAGRQEASLDASNVDASALAAAVASGSPWRPLLPADARLTGPAPGRSYDVYVPASYDPAKPAPLVVMLHGRGNSGYGMAALTRMNAVADAHGFVVAYPESYGDSWNYYQGVPGVVPRSQVDDLAFLRRLVARLALDLNLDPARLYVAGFSNGGFMAERAACGVSDEFAAFAVVSAEMLPEMVADCNVTPSAPMVIMQGTDDSNVPWAGIVVTQQGRQRYATLPAAQSLSFWTLRNLCAFLPDQQTLPAAAGDPTHVVRVRYAPCAHGRDVTFYAIQGGGHNWPGGAAVLPAAVAGTITHTLDASQTIWSFFASHPMDAERNRPDVPVPGGP